MKKKKAELRAALKQSQKSERTARTYIHLMGEAQALRQTPISVVEKLALSETMAALGRAVSIPDPTMDMTHPYIKALAHRLCFMVTNITGDDYDPCPDYMFLDTAGNLKTLEVRLHVVPKPD